MSKPNQGLTNLKELSKLAFSLPPISKEEANRRRAARQHANRLRQAALRQSEQRAAARSPSSTKRGNSPGKKNKSPSPKRKSPSPKRHSSPRATIQPPNAFRGAIAHTVARNGTIYYLMPVVPTGRIYNFGRPVPWENVRALLR